MTDAEQKAVELVNDARRRNFLPVLSAQTITGSVSFPALRYAIEDHERFRQEVSDAVTEVISIIENGEAGVAAQELERFIIAKPDPLAEALTECGINPLKSGADKLRAALAKRGGRIVFDD